MILVSRPFWEGLDDDQKAAFDKAAVEAGAAMRAFVDEVETSGVETLKERGMEVNELSAEERPRSRPPSKPPTKATTKPTARTWSSRS